MILALEASFGWCVEIQLIGATALRWIPPFRQFLTRGLQNAQGEWTLVCLAWNLKRMAVLRP